MPAFSRADLLQRLPQPVAMIEADRADHRHVGGHEIGGIEAAAEPNFQQRQLDTALGEQLQRRQRVVFEERQAGGAAHRLDALEGRDYRRIRPPPRR